jgi:DNA-binding GntR family transcriptional regulator
MAYLILLISAFEIAPRNVHQRFPTGDVVVSEEDLAEQLRNRSDAVVTALNLLLNEQKVERAPLSGYWKLNL